MEEVNQEQQVDVVDNIPASDNVLESQGNDSQEKVQTDGEELKALEQAQKALEEKEAALFQKEVELTLKDAGLADFKDVVKVANADELQTTIKALNKIINARKIDQSFKPEGHKQTDKYSQAEKEGNVVGMISHKLSGLFK